MDFGNPTGSSRVAAVGMYVFERTLCSLYKRMATMYMVSDAHGGT